MADYSELDPQDGVAGPPKDEAEVKQRMSGWQQFLSSVQNDPAVTMGVLRFATQMMQPVAPGQTALGHGAAALEDSINYAAVAKQQRELQARQIAESEAKRGLEGAQAEHLAAQAADVTARTPGAVQIQDALTKLYGSHARYYDLMSQAAADKSGTRQLLHSTKVENADGSQTIVNTHAVNGKLYIESYTPPRFTDEAMARAQAQKDVDKITPFFGKAPYEGTKADEIRRRTAKYLGGQRMIAGPGGQALSPEQFDQLEAGATPNTPPKQLSPGERGMQKDVVMSPDERAADAVHDASPANLNELKTTLANAKDPKIRSLLQGELDRIQSAGKQVAAGPTKVVRNADGTLSITGENGSGTVPPGKPGQPAPETPTPQAAGFDAAKAALSEAQGKLATYGSVQRRRDPQGYEAAKAAVVAAKKAFDEASNAYQGSVEPQAARMPLRVK